MDLASLRKEYQRHKLKKKNLPVTPIELFSNWFQQAQEAKILEPNAMVLATVDAKGYPTQRTVLLKYYDKNGFVFFTNYHSHKAIHISKNPAVSIHFLWKNLERQIQITGTTKKVSTRESLQYFLKRPKGSQIGAWVSKQSSIISSRSILEAKYKEMKNKFSSGSIPLPDFWGGYRITPQTFEFWQGGKNRLHDRFRYTLDESQKWKIKRLMP